jgi:hypothetical protein
MPTRCAYNDCPSSTPELPGLTFLSQLFIHRVLSKQFYSSPGSKTQPTGKILSTAPFKVGPVRSYIAVGCENGLYVLQRGEYGESLAHGARSLPCSRKNRSPLGPSAEGTHVYGRTAALQQACGANRRFHICVSSARLGGGRARPGKALHLGRVGGEDSSRRRALLPDGHLWATDAV